MLFSVRTVRIVRDSIRGFSVLVIVCMALAGLGGCLTSRASLSGLKGQQVPIIRFTSLEGQYRSLHEFRGKPVVLVFWAEWCGFSKPVVEDLNDLASRVSPNVATFVALSVDPATSFERLQRRVEGQRLFSLLHAFSGNALLDEAYQALHGQDLPHVFVLNEEGVLIEEGHDAAVAEAGLKKLGVLG